MRFRPVGEGAQSVAINAFLGVSEMMHRSAHGSAQCSARAQARCARDVARNVEGHRLTVLQPGVSQQGDVRVFLFVQCAAVDAPCERA